ncbi:MAG: hypothetical protein K2P33_10820 [Acutalibacter sp.]|nr:hypothetical protein [Acutalibacter sp.]
MQINPVRNTINHELTAQQIQRAQQAREASRSPQEKPVEQGAKGEFYQAPDQYTPQKPEGAPGLYEIEASQEGPRVSFAPPKEAPGSQKEQGRPAEVTTTDTDQVDREIEAARKKVEDLRGRADQVQGPEKERLERLLKRAESELERKDNDSYRRQHAKIR